MDDSSGDNNNANIVSSTRYDPTLQSYVQQQAPAESKPGLCPRCSSINFGAIDTIDIDGFTDARTRLAAQSVFWPRSTLDTPFPSFFENRDSLVWTTVPVFDLGPSLLCEPRCRLCRFLDAVSRSVQNYQPASHWYLGVTTVKKKRMFLVGTSATWQQDTVDRGDLELSSIETDKRDDDDGHILTQDFPIQYDLLCSEIIACQNEDVEFAFENTEYTDQFVTAQLWLIDCHELRVVNAPANTRYVALSYVWGDKARSTDLMLTPNGTMIRERLCKTVEDAIVATLKLGVDYLWVDRYCIDQEDLDVKARQLGQMHQIFRQAWVTVVALGADDDAGLPGVTSQRERLAVPIPGYEIIHVGPDVVACHKLSKWSSRAWTYQECCLSPRLLSFASNQVLLTCQHGSLSESEPKRYHKMYNDLRTPKLHFDELEVPVNKAKLLESQYGIVLDFQDALKNYCSRLLSYELDSLLAIQGYLTYLDIPFCKGIPLFATNRQDSPEIDNDDNDNNQHRADRLIGGSVGLGWFERPQRLSVGPPQSPLSAPAQGSRANIDTPTDRDICNAFPSWSWTSCRTGVKGFTCHNLTYDQINASKIVATATDIRIHAAHTDTLYSWTDADLKIDDPNLQLSNHLHLQTRLSAFRIPAQKINDSLFDFQNSYLGGFLEVSNFSGVELAWPVLSNMAKLGLEAAAATITVTFHADRRGDCACHDRLNVSLDPRELTEDVCGMAALLFVETEEVVERYAAAHWLALRRDEVIGTMRRVGIIRVDFGIGHDAAILKGAENEGGVRETLLPIWKSLTATVREDMRREGHVDWVIVR